MKFSNKAKGIIFIILSCITFAIMPVLIRYLGKGGLPPTLQVFFRYIVAFVCALIFFVASKKTQFKFEKKDLPILLIATVFGYALLNLFYTYAVLLTQVNNAYFLFSTYIIITPALGYFILKEKLNKFNIIALILCFISLILFFQPNSFDTWKLGGFFAILSALAQAFYIVLRRKLSNYSAGQTLLMNTFIGVVVIGLLSVIIEPQFYLRGQIANIQPQIWVATIVFGIDNFVAWLCMTKGFEYLKATTGSIVLLTELLFIVLFSFLFLGEIPLPLTLIGGVIMLVATVLVILKGKN